MCLCLLCVVWAMSCDINFVNDFNLNFLLNSDSDGGSGYKEEVRQRVEAIIEPTQYNPDLLQTATDSPIHGMSTNTADIYDTWVYPMVQMGPFGITVDQQVTTSLLTKFPVGSNIKLASGYFNLTNHYKDTIINESQADFNILTASPQV